MNNAAIFAKRTWIAQWEKGLRRVAGLIQQTIIGQPCRKSWLQNKPRKNQHYTLKNVTSQSPQ